MKVICNDKGEFTLNGALLFLFVMLLLVLGLSVISIGPQQMRVDSMASELTRYIEIHGKIDSSVTEELERLEAATGMYVELNIEADYLSASNQTIQYGDSFTVTLTYQTSFGAGGILKAPITLHGIGSGRSEQYWK